MEQQADLKALAKQVYRSYHQDGLLDIYLGWFFFCVGLRVWQDDSLYIVIFWVTYLFYETLKNKLTVPRLGYVKLNDQYFPKGKIRLGLIPIYILVASLLVSTLLFILGRVDVIEWLLKSSVFIFGTFNALLLLVYGFLAHSRRWFAYGILCLLLLLGVTLDRIPDYLFYILLGLAIILSGGITMIRFIRKYPLAREEEGHVPADR